MVQSSTCDSPASQCPEVWSQGYLPRQRTTHCSGEELLVPALCPPACSCGRSWGVTTRFLQGFQNWAPCWEPSCFWLSSSSHPVSMPTSVGPRSSPTSLTGSLTSEHLGLTKTWDVHSSSVFPVSHFPTGVSSAHPASPFSCWGFDCYWQRQIEIK